MAKVVLHGYFRSSTSFRARMALNLKGVNYEQVTHHLRKGEHKGEDYLSLNPQGLVPSLVWSDGTVLTQSMAIMEFLDEIIPEPPLLPRDPLGRARVRSILQMICCDIHPVNNMRVLKALGSRFGADEEAVSNWFTHWVAETFGPLEQMLASSRETGRQVHGDQVTMADLGLVSQVFNNRRFGVSLDPYPTIEGIFERTVILPEIERAIPANQPDAE
ncbi:MAG: maleylacetoacetate isomerase [Natronospirillum sp.]|uniref:maleylacetoacetate isomerase n=1 Tax=Natronospirillum sp. TaxID=2812955 RepID=UPI0025D55506|nr:maleylacetoacetate isomerase [Natronospirillum sp.]MCH8550340.1 maleylacetoacetate isomerase [Natronospirillum sp.]